MHLTPDAAREPERPPELAIHMWHPQAWDIHSLAGGGRDLPDAAFYYLVNGRKQPPIMRGR